MAEETIEGKTRSDLNNIGGSSSNDKLKWHRRNQPVQEFVINKFALDRKIKEACKGLMPETQWLIKREIESDQDKELVADFILQWSDHGKGGDGGMMSPNTKRVYVASLVYLLRYVKNVRNGGRVYRSFREITRDDFFAKEDPKGYLESLKRDFSDDPDKKWVSTHNTRLARYLAFWKWLTQPELKAEERQEPPQLKGYRFARRQAKTSVKREHLWTPEEHAVFLNRCEDLRLACYHAIALDTGGRPSELLDLKLGDIKVETVASTGKKKSEFVIGRKGKSKRGRMVRICNAIPYYNVWAHVHPSRDAKNPHDAYLFPSLENKAKYLNRPLKENSLRMLYVRALEKHLPKLLHRPDILPQEKEILKSLIYRKPHYPYLRRHEFASELAPRVPQFSFNQLMGHSRTSQMYDVYVQDLGNEGLRELEIADGIITREETLSAAQVERQPKYCPICRESNKHNAKFCFRCNFIISMEGYLENNDKEAEAAKEAEQQKKDLEEVRTQQKEQTKLIRSMMEYIQTKQEEAAKEDARKKGQEWNGAMATTWDEELYGPYSSANPRRRGTGTI